MQVRTQPASLLSFRRDLGKSALIALCAAGLIWITGCGSSGTKSGGGGTPPPPTPSSSGLTIYPSTASVAVGAQVIFTGYVPSQQNATITWAVSGSSSGSITTNSAGQGVYTAPTSVPSPAQVAITATSGNFSATAVVTIAAAQGVTVSPAAAAIPAGSQTTFGASVNGTAAAGVTWEVNGTAGGDAVHGTINASGTYTAPLSPPPGGSTVITAVVGGSSGTATATVVYSNASLDGNYSFSYTGDDGSGFLGITGEFTAASGNITGTEDFLDANSGPSTGQSLNGTYSIGPDGRGIVDLTSSSGEVWLIALSSSEHALLINFNQGSATVGGATGSGTIDQQTYSTPLATGRYVFQLAGLDKNGFSAGVAGAFSSFGNGSLAPSGNTMDVNDSGSVTSDDTSLTGTFSGNSLSLESSAFTSLAGGTATFDFYVANSNHLRLIETDGKALLVGDIFAAPAEPSGGYTASLLPSSNYAFTLGGATQSPYAAGGVFISNGGSGGTSTSGSITGGIFDSNNGGVHFQSDAALKSSTYGVDQNTGRISSSITTPAGTFDWVGYVTAPVDPTTANSVEVLMLESDSNATASGIAYLQSSTAQPAGSFAFNLTGQATGNSAGEQDVLAQLAIGGTAPGGTIDINNFALGQLLQGLSILSTKSTIASTDGNGRGTMTVVAADGASFPLAYYVIDSNRALFLETDSQRVMTGMMLKQF
jgi:hypothetical protein